MDIVIVAQYLGNLEQINKNNNRFLYIANILKENHQVEIVTSEFIHGLKKHNKETVACTQCNRITKISEPGYKKNVCLKRFYSHHILGKNVYDYLSKREKPDIIYCAVPSLSCAYMVSKYCQKNGVRFVIDIQDLWPEAFRMVFDIPIIGNILYGPMKAQADYIYRRADAIVAVSKTYCDRANISSDRYVPTEVVYLGTDIDYFDKCGLDNKQEKKKDRFIIGYTGTLGHSYDLKCVIDAMKIIQEKGHMNVDLYVIGDGPKRVEFESYANEHCYNTYFWGRLEYPQMCGLLFICDICINPISKGSFASIINKHADYAAAGVPVINTQESKEYRQLVAEYECGINCNCGNAEDVAEAIIYLIEHEEERIKMGLNSRKMAEDLFDRKHTYENIKKLLQR